MDSDVGGHIAALQAATPHLAAYDAVQYVEYVPLWTELWLAHVYRIPSTATQLHQTAQTAFRVVEGKVDEFLRNAKDDPAAQRDWVAEICASGVVMDPSDPEGTWRSFEDILQDSKDWFHSELF